MEKMAKQVDDVIDYWVTQSVLYAALTDWLNKLERAQEDPRSVKPEDLSAAFTKLTNEVTRLQGGNNATTQT